MNTSTATETTTTATTTTLNNNVAPSLKKPATLNNNIVPPPSKKSKKMSALEKLKEIGHSKPYKGFKTLDLGDHPIVRFRVVANKQYRETQPAAFKKALMVELAEEVLFLPHYFFDRLNCSEKEVEELNKDPIQKYLWFGGAREENG